MSIIYIIQLYTYIIYMSITASMSGAQRITDSCELPCGCWGLNLDLLEEQLVLFPTESSL